MVVRTDSKHIGSRICGEAIPEEHENGGPFRRPSGTGLLLSGYTQGFAALHPGLFSSAPSRELLWAETPPLIAEFSGQIL
jgi:hypothetical protein